MPPRLLERASTLAGVPPTQSIRIVALFETLGHPAPRAAQKEMDNFEFDMQKQLRAWSDAGHTRRTETDLNDLNGPELFHENYLDYID